MNHYERPARIDEDERLCCPKCGDSCGTHHYEVVCYHRRSGEERPTSRHVYSFGGADWEIKDFGNPSRYRNGVAVRFWCEICDVVFELCFAQHKGVTHVSTRQVGVTEDLGGPV